MIYSSKGDQYKIDLYLIPLKALVGKKFTYYLESNMFLIHVESRNYIFHGLHCLRRSRHQKKLVFLLQEVLLLTSPKNDSKVIFHKNPCPFIISPERSN